MLTVEGVRKTFPAGRGNRTPAPALDGVDLAVPEGSLTTVLGPSGSGKTTLLRCIAGFETPDSGVIVLAGRRLVAPGTRGVPAHARGIGVVPQEGALFPHLNVAENVGFGLVGQSRRSRRSRVDALLDLVGLPGLGGRRPHELSGGQQQRVALARALAPEPRLVLLDEPFSALDARLRTGLREEVRNLLKDVGTTAVLVTHDQAEAMTMADDMVVMRAGRVLAAGSPRDIYHDPGDAELGRFLGEATILPGRIARTGGGVRATCALGQVEVRAWHGDEGECQVLIRPEHLTVTPPAPHHGDAVVGVVTRQSFFGADALLHVTLRASGQTVAVRVPGHEPREAGELVELHVVRPVSAYPHRPVCSRRGSG